jgi:hypothetical protein
VDECLCKDPIDRSACEIQYELSILTGSMADSCVSSSNDSICAWLGSSGGGFMSVAKVAIMTFGEYEERLW